MAKKPHVVQLEDGKWYRIANGSAPYWHECCDCSLVHRVAYKVENGHIWEQWTRDEKKTRSARRRKQVSDVDKG